MKLVDEELSPNLEESILNIVADRPKSSTRAAAYKVGVSYQIVCLMFLLNVLGNQIFWKENLKIAKQNSIINYYSFQNICITFVIKFYL